MIFYKNILKKEKIISYIFLITIISLFSLGVIFVKDYLQVKQNKINNSIEKRTIIVDDIIECNNYMIEKCEYEDSITKVLVKNIKNKEEVMKSIGENHFLYTDSSDIDKYDFFVDSMNILFCITLISFLVMLFTLIIQFNKDDEQTIKIMRCIGYSKIKVFTINYFILFSILCGIFIGLASKML